MSFYPVGKITLPNNIPRSPIMCRTVPAAITIKIIKVTIVDDIVRTAY
jgi:hypothetical protein